MQICRLFQAVGIFRPMQRGQVGHGPTGRGIGDQTGQCSLIQFDIIIIIGSGGFDPAPVSSLAPARPGHTVQRSMDSEEEGAELVIEAHE